MEFKLAIFFIVLAGIGGFILGYINNIGDDDNG